MGSEWFEGQLVDACSSVDYGLTESAVTDPVGPRFLRITDIATGPIDWRSVPYVATDDATLSKYRLWDGDIVIARTGASTGASSYIKAPPPAVFASYLVRLKIKPDFDARFISYYLKSPAFKAFIEGVLGDKSAQPNASASTMVKAPLRAPRKKADQEFVSRVLGALDDKIELNRRMNGTLEALAQAVFKEWFVDVDRLKRLPHGWARRQLGDVLKETNDRVGNRHVPEYSSTNQGLQLREDLYRKQLAKSSEKNKLIKEGYIVFGLSRRVLNFGLMRDVAGSVSPVYRVFDIDRSVVPPDFLYTLMRANHDYFYTAVSASSREGQSISLEGLLSLNFILPTRERLNEYYQLIAPFRERQDVIQKEGAVLSALRDTLLPKLMRGEVRVSTQSKRSR